MAVSAGRYRNRVLVVKYDGGRDEYGGATKTRVEISKPWCKVVPLADVENASGERTVGQELFEFEIRYSKQLEAEGNVPDSSMFLEYKGIEYDIITVLNHLDLNEKLKMVAKKR